MELFVIDCSQISLIVNFSLSFTPTDTVSLHFLELSKTDEELWDW